MNRSVSLFSGVILLSLAFALSALPVDTAVSPYPFISVTPQRPVAQVSDVSLQLVVGSAGNSCMAPTYKDVSVTVVKSPLEIYPPIYNVTLKFTEVVDPSKMCPMIYAPVDYGPQFELGKLRVGHYQVLHGGRALGAFTVSDTALSTEIEIKGVVVDDPYPLKRMPLPISRAKVYLMTYAEYDSPMPYLQGSSDNQQVAIWLPPQRIVDSALTSDLGTFAFGSVAPGSYTVQVSHEQFHPLNSAVYLEKDTVLEFSMLSTKARAAVSGVVTLRTGNLETLVPVPLSGCTVSVYQLLPPIMYLDQATEQQGVMEPGRVVSGVYSAITDERGHYTISDIALLSNGEEWQVSVRRAGYSSPFTTVQLRTATTTQTDFVLEQLYANSASVTENGIVYTIATDRSMYALFDPVRVRYSIVNTTRTTVSFEGFSGNCEYDMAVALARGQELFRLSQQQQFCTRMLTSIEIAPGDSVVHEFAHYYYLDDVASSSERPQAPQEYLVVSAALRGTRYPQSEASVRIEYGSGSVASRQSAKSVLAVAQVGLEGGGRYLSVSVPRAQTITVTHFGLDGRKIASRSLSKSLAAGTTRIALPGRAPAAGILRVSGEGIEKTLRVGGVLGL